MRFCKLLRWLFVALVCVIALPTAALAQSAIGGTVKDTSGAVLPGVTVEVASDVLIEKTKTVSTDGQGQYTIVDLRPGVYVITFSLQGFNTFKREGLELPSNFTATVNADMKVGALEESVTVSGSSPVVDVQSNQKTQVLSRDVLDAVPTGKTIQGLGQLVVGVTGGTAETITGGITMNLVPKDGGNRFAGALKYGKSPASWQGDNLTPRLQALGVKAVDKISNFYEFNVEQGGPIMKDKLWFFGAFRRAHYDKPIANTFDLPAGANIPKAFKTCLDNPSSCEQGVSDEKMDNPVVRLTWQISLHGSRDALPRPRDGRQHRPGDRVGRVAYPDVRDRLGQVDIDRVVQAARGGRLLVQS